MMVYNNLKRSFDQTMWWSTITSKELWPDNMMVYNNLKAVLTRQCGGLQ